MLCSFTEKPCRFKLPAAFSGPERELLFANYPCEEAETAFVTRPYEMRVYRVQAKG